MKKGILKKYLEKDKRLNEVIKLSKPVYDKVNLANHNFNFHIAQVLYRALIITESDNLKVNFSILISACILHDIGYSINFKKVGHEKAGEEISRKILNEAGFSVEEVNKVIEAIIKYLTPGVSTEADVLFDADVLNQAGYASMYPFFVSLYEYKQFPEGKEEIYKLDKFLDSRIKIVEDLEKMGLRTKAGREILRDGFKERREFIEQARSSLEEREDFLITFNDLF